MNKMNKRLNIGILSDSPTLVTGYRNQSFNIANILADKGHNVYYFASNYLGQNLKPGVEFEDSSKTKFWIIGQGREQYFKDLLPIYTKQLNLDVLFILLDTFMLYPWLMQLDLSPAKTIFYYPSDGGGGMPLGCDQILKFVNCPVAMAQFGQKQVEKMYNIKTLHIPHGVNTNLFRPLSKEERLNIRRMFGISDDKFVVGTVARNQGRKMLDRTVKAFALYAKKNPNAILFMHTDPDDAAQVFHLPSLINRYGIANRVLFSGMRYFKGFTDEQMNSVYNIMDVFILTTSGEGFGIPIIEAMSAGIPVVVTDYTTTREIVTRNKAGLAIKLVGDNVEDNPDEHTFEILDGTITGSWNVERGMCSVKDAALAIDILEKDKNMREIMGKNGRIAALSIYDWKVNGPKWTELIEKLGGQY